MTTMPHVVAFTRRPCRTGGGVAPSPDALAPIEGVTLERYAIIVRGIAAYNYDRSMLPSIAADHGIGVGEWRDAHIGWNARIQADPAVARRFSDIYHGL
jgi:hypothetical protein